MPIVAATDNVFPTTTGTRLSAVVRLVACFAAAHNIFQLTPSAQRNAAAPVAILFLFSLYVAALYYKVVRDPSFQEQHYIYWIDALWYLALTALTGSQSSNFSFFLPFPVLFVALRWGFAPAIKLVLFSTGALLTLSIVRAGVGPQLISTEIILPPVALLVLGYLIASSANSHLVLQRRLATLHEINALFSPRLNIEQVIDRTANYLATIYNINKYIVVLAPIGIPARIFRANLPEAMYQVSDVTATEFSGKLLALDISDGPIIFTGEQGLRQVGAIHENSPSQVANSDRLAGAAMLASRMDCANFAALQFSLRDGGIARLFVCSNEPIFGPTDLPFFNQLAEQLSLRIENVQLLDRLASEVAEHERQKISRDIHDSAIQPYIGLKFALEALARKAAPTDPLAKDISRLAEMAQGEISELRRYVRGLRGQSEGEAGHATLLPALRRQAARYGDLYGIQVDVESTGELRLGDKVANDVFHIVGEALSNIRRHTTATVAHINLFCDEHHFRLQITNPCEQQTPAKIFTPRSIAERAQGLNGNCQVEIGQNTTVIVEIPLQKS